MYRLIRKEYLRRENETGKDEQHTPEKKLRSHNAIRNGPTNYNIPCSPTATHFRNVCNYYNRSCVYLTNGQRERFFKKHDE